MVPAKGLSLVSRSAGAAGDIFAASASGDAGIIRLVPLPFAQQARALAERNELSAALEMASLVPSTQVQPYTPCFPAGECWLSSHAVVLLLSHARGMMTCIKQRVCWLASGQRMHSFRGRRRPFLQTLFSLNVL